MASGYGKQNFGQKVKGTLRRIFMLSVIGGTFIGAPAYYQYGTIKTEEVKVKEVKAVWDHYDSKKGESVYNYRITTEKGTVLKNENTTLHFKFNSKDIQDQLNDGRDEYRYSSSYSPWSFGDDNNNSQQQQKKDPALDPSNKVWRITYYGARIDIPFIHTYPNVLSVEEVSRDELAARAKAQQQAQRDQAQQIKKDQGAVVPPGQQNGTVTTPAPAGALSGTMITFETVVNGQRIELTVPIEAAGKVTVNKVSPLVPPAPKGPGG